MRKSVTYSYRLAALLVAFACAACDSKRSPSQSTSPTSQPAVASGRFAGSASCAKCHPEPYADWETSHHARAQRAIDLAVDREAFDPPREIVHGRQSSRVRVDGGKLLLTTQGENGEQKSFEPIGALGYRPLWQYLIPSDSGRIQLTELAFDPVKKEWFNVYGQEDRRAGEWGHWTGRGMNWNSMCATCHTTAFEKNYDAAGDKYASTYREMGVGCESCHGPLQDHVDWQAAHPNQKGDPFSKGHEPWPVYLDTCLGCHSRRADLTGAYQHGGKFLDHYELVLPDLSDTFYPDGQVREEDFEGAAYSLSYMHGAGIRCMDCHGVHTGRIHTRGNELCLRCHQAGVNGRIPINPVRHGRHPMGKEGSFCVDCHMPITPYMQRHLRRDHGMTTPDPLLTKEHGIPNACNRCHADKSVDWAIETTNEWYGARLERPTRKRAQLLARLKKADLSAVDGVIGLIGTERNAAWRAVYAKFLASVAAEPPPGVDHGAIVDGLTQLLKDSSPLPQAAAIESLEPLIDPALGYPGREGLVQKFAELLGSPTRLVRIKSAWALRHLQPWNAAPAPAGAAQAKDDLLAMLRFNQDQPLGAMRWAQYLVDTGQPAKAAPWYEKAIAWDPNAAAFRHAYAMTLDVLGKPEEAIVQAARASELEPNQAAHVYALGLLYAEIQKLPEARDALKAATAAEPGQPRYWYNLGLAETRLGRIEEGLTAIERAEQLDPRSPMYPHVRATILAQAGRIDEAKVAARRALQINPQYREAQELLAQLESGR